LFHYEKPRAPDNGYTKYQQKRWKKSCRPNISGRFFISAILDFTVTRKSSRTPLDVNPAGRVRRYA
jgi:hypothetical protein